MAYDKRFAFRVEIDGITVAAFETAGPWEATTERVKRREGGADAKNEPGLVDYSVVTLTKGMTDNRELYDWWYNVNVNKVDDFRNGSLVQCDRAGNEIRRRDFTSAWPSRYKWGEHDSKASEDVIEEMDLSVDSIEDA